MSPTPDPRRSRTPSRTALVLRRFGPGLAALALLLVGSEPAAARQLHWDLLAVEARLGADGQLHVTETQTMVFTGDWNGGQRDFDLDLGQKLHIKSVTRLAPDGTEVTLEKGTLALVDHWDWADGKVLRWRSRRPSDPLFDETAITYRLSYRLSGILRRIEPGAYRLDHDFAFPDRLGVVERFTLDLELDPAWRPRTELPLRLVRENLVPGRSMVLDAELVYLDAGKPGAAINPVPGPVGCSLFGAAFFAIAFLLTRYLEHERAHGRFSPDPAPTQLDRAWLEEHLFDLLPEEAGALWDRKIGAPEVAAVLARMVAEGKLASRVIEKQGILGRDELELELLNGRGSLAGYELDLVDKLFFDGRNITTTGDVRDHYRKTGFNPSSVIKGRLERRVQAKEATWVSQERGPAPMWSLGTERGEPGSRLGWKLFGLIVVALGLETLFEGAMVWALLGVGAVLMLPLLVFIPALATQIRRWTRGLPLAIAILVGLLGWAWMIAAAMGLTPSLASGSGFPVPGIFGLLALAVLPVWLAYVSLKTARTQDAAPVVRRRQRLGQARRMLAAELDRESPDLEDDWFPYLLAFGLQSKVDRWFKAFGGTAAATTGGFVPSSSGSVGSSSGGGWTGGGGSFGGAGATSSWAAAATGMAAGVAAPSSSGGSSGGGGGGSSGGGGGGGW